MCAVVWAHPVEAAASPAVQLGTLRWEVAKIAFDACKVMFFFTGKVLVFHLRYPARYSHLRAHLEEQLVPAALDPLPPCLGEQRAPDEQQGGAGGVADLAAGGGAGAAAGGAGASAPCTATTGAVGGAAAGFMDAAPPREQQ